jgi:hypothetical protein
MSTKTELTISASSNICVVRNYQRRSLDIGGGDDMDSGCMSFFCSLPTEPAQAFPYSKSLVTLATRYSVKSPRTSNFDIERPSSTPVKGCIDALDFVNYSHPSEARTPQNRKRIRSLISKKQHQREKLLKTCATSQALRAGKTADVASLRLSHETATLQAAPTYKEIIVQSETLLDRQLRETYRRSKDLEYVNVSALRWYAYSLESWVSLLAMRG